jgi:ABC-type hemin transport system substrate-binding protein
VLVQGSYPFAYSVGETGLFPLQATVAGKLVCCTFRQPAMYPERIVCLTEEPTEVLYALGEEGRIVGISGFTVRPPRARREKPKVSAFLSAKVEEILALKPDLAIGFSDIQADIAQALIKRGVEVSARWSAPAKKPKRMRDSWKPMWRWSASAHAA